MLFGLPLSTTRLGSSGMSFLTRVLFLVSLLAQFSQAVDIVGYSRPSCRGDIVHACRNIGPQQCCSFAGHPLPLSVQAELNSPTRFLISFRPSGSQMCGRSVASAHPPPGVVCVTNPDGSSITGAEWAQPNAAMMESLLALSVDQQTTSSTGVAYTNPVSGIGGESTAANSTGGIQGVGVGLLKADGNPEPSLVWQPVWNENAVEAVKLLKQNLPVLPIMQTSGGAHAIMPDNWN